MFVNFNILNQLGSPAINSNTFANRPAAGQTGRLFVSTDTYEIYRDNGTTWDLIGGPGSSTITGTGTANYITKFTGTQSIGNSIMTEGTGLITITGTDPRFVIGGTDDGSSQLQTYSNVNTRWKFQVSSDNATDDADITGYKSRGTVAAPTAILAGDSITNYSGRGYNGTAFSGGAGIDIFAEENYTAIAAGTYLILQTTSIGATSETEKIRLTANGFLGINTSTPGARLDVHSTGTIAQFNTTSGTGNTYIAFQRTGTGLWRIGDTYNGGNNFFELHNTVLGTDALEFEAATNKSTFQAQQTYTTGLARGNYFDYNLSVAAGGSFSSPNAITALTATLDLTLAGNATIPSGARSGLDAYNTIAFTGAGTLTHNQGTQIRAYSNVTAGWAFAGSAVGTITHLAGLHALFPDNSGSAVNVTNNYALLLNDQTANTGTVTYTNRWGVYQEGASDLNYLNANLLLGSTVNNGNKLQVTGNGNLTGTLTLGNTGVTNAIINSNDGMYFNIDADSSGGSPEFMWGKQRSGAGAGGTTFMTITNAGLVGIGTNAPVGKLDVNTGTGATFRVIQNATNIVEIGNSSAASGYQELLLVGSPMTFYTGTAGATSATEKMRITSAGKVFIQTSSASTTSAYGQGDLSIENNLFASLQVMSHNNSSGNFSFLGLGKSRGTGAAPTVVADGEILSEIQNYGYDGSAYRIATQIRTAVQGTPAAGYVPGYLSFHTNNGSLLERARIVNNGNFLIGTTTDAGQKLQVAGTVSATGKLTVNTSISNGVAAEIINTNTTNGFGLVVQGGVSGVSYAFNVVNAANTIALFTVNGNGSISTAAPTTGTSGNWKLGSRVAATVVVNTNEYIEVDIGGTLYKLATVT